VKFNDIELFANTAGTAVTLQVGANAGDTITLTTKGVDVTGLGDVKNVGAPTDPDDPGTATSATAALAALEVAIDSVNSERAVYGASMSRLDNVIVNLRTGYEAQMASYSRIMDADFARETANMSRWQILQQAGVAMVAQANAMPQNVLGLMR